MAPDINTMPVSQLVGQNSQAQYVQAPPSQPTTSTSRRISRIMARTSVPPVNHQPYHSPVLSGSEQPTGVPLRHPRPLTAIELYLEVEKEQEAVVNRLTRDLSALRAQTASVASNVSHSSTSTSASLLPMDISDPNPTHQMTGATHPTPSRSHRSSSSLSTRSIPTPSTSASVAGSVPPSAHHQPGGTAIIPIGGVSQASADRAAAATGQVQSLSGTSTPARQSLDLARHNSTAAAYSLPLRPSSSREPSHNAPPSVSSMAAQAGTPMPHRYPSPAQPSSVAHAMQHYAETAAYRSEMELVKAENEALRQRVRALERALRARRRDSSQSDTAHPSELNTRSARDSLDLRPSHSGMPSPGGVAAWAARDEGVGGVAGPRERSESQSTTASSRRGIGFGDDEVRVGESASSVGLGRGS